MSYIIINEGFKLLWRYLLISLIAVTIVSSCKHHKDFSVIILSDLHYDTSISRSLVLDTIIDKINSMRVLKSVPPVRFVNVLGDITDSGSLPEWQNYTRAFGVNGDNKIKYPVFETFGNHDGNVDGPVRTGISERNRKRENLISISDNGLFCSWNQGSVHFVSLGLYPGLEWDPECEWCLYFKESFRDPQMSLQFLENDLMNNLKNSDQPIVLFFHYGWDNFSLLWWTESEQERLYETVKQFNITAIFHGHNHSTEHYLWHNINVWAAGSPQRGDRTGNMLLVSFLGDSISVSVIEADSLK